jgi:hypothetical protein
MVWSARILIDHQVYSRATTIEKDELDTTNGVAHGCVMCSVNAWRSANILKFSATATTNFDMLTALGSSLTGISEFVTWGFRHRTQSELFLFPVGG